MAEEAIGRLSIRELIVDFLGSLVPGLIFVSCSLFIVGWPLRSGLTLMLTELGSAKPASSIYADIAMLAGAMRIELTVLLVMISYVAGCFFYRQDPKVPDLKSFGKMAAQAENWVAERNNCEFPYPHFDRYLISRGIRHLLPLTEWCAGRRGQRTKNFLNILKIRLFFEHPEKCGSIARNEAHVRLMSSTWYMSRSLRQLSKIAGGIVVVTSVAAALFNPETPISAAMLHAIPGVPALAAYLVAVAAMHTIERFLHYQRVREVMWVLETAYVAYRDKPVRLHDICPDFGKPAEQIEALRGVPAPA